MWGRLPHEKGQGQKALPFFCTLVWCAVLEQNLQRKLDLSAGGGRPSDLTEVTIYSSAAGKSRISGAPKVGPVENVEELGPELNLGRLRHKKALENREIQGGCPRTDTSVAPQGSKSTRAGDAIGKRNHVGILKVVLGVSKPGVGIPGVGAVISAGKQVGPSTAANVAGDP